MEFKEFVEKIYSEGFKLAEINYDYHIVNKEVSKSYLHIDLKKFNEEDEWESSYRCFRKYFDKGLYQPLQDEVTKKRITRVFCNYEEKNDYISNDYVLISTDALIQKKLSRKIKHEEMMKSYRKLCEDPFQKYVIEQLGYIRRDLKKLKGEKK